MTAKQKAARAKFKAVVAEAKKLRKKNPKLTQAQAVKQAWAISYSKERSGKKLGALPIDFKGNFLGYRFKVLNQYQLDGGVTAQLVELDGRGDIITELSGNTRENDRAADVLYSGAIASGKDIYLDEKDKKDLQKRIKSFVVGLNKEVSAYNSGKDTSKKKSKGLKISYKPETKKLAVVDQIKSILKENKKILKGGYSMKTGKIREAKVAGIKQTKYLGAASSKVKAKKGKSTEMHTDTKSHNVNIRVVSGMNTRIMSGVKEIDEQIEYWTNKLENSKKEIKYLQDKNVIVLGKQQMINKLKNYHIPKITEIIKYYQKQKKLLAKNIF